MKYLSISLAIVALIIGLGIGYSLTPQYSQTVDMMNSDLGKADRFYDLRYSNAMIAHHRSAMLMAEQVKDTSQRKEIRDLAAEILATEPERIAELYQWKKEWYRDTAQVRDPLYPKFGSFDDTYDLRFLNALISHHEEGIVMAKDAQRKSSRSEILKNADAVNTFLTTTAGMLKGWRDQWYKIN